MFPALSAATVLVTTAVASRPSATVVQISVGSELERTLNTAVALAVTPATAQVPAASRVVPATVTAAASVAKASGMFAVMACPTASHASWHHAAPHISPLGPEQGLWVLLQARAAVLESPRGGKWGKMTFFAVVVEQSGGLWGSVAHSGVAVTPGV